MSKIGCTKYAIFLNHAIDIQTQQTIASRVIWIPYFQFAYYCCSMYYQICTCTHCVLKSTECTVHIQKIGCNLMCFSLCVLQWSLIRIYVYDWPGYLIDIWPNMTRSSDDMKLNAKDNFGTGAILNASIGLHETFQFSMAITLHGSII